MYSSMTDKRRANDMPQLPLWLVWIAAIGFITSGLEGVINFV